MTVQPERAYPGARFLTLPQFCQRYQVSRSTIYRLARNNAFTIVKFGRSSRIAFDEAEAWAASLPVMGGRG
jgi:excisionase family DNA binding protein